MEFRQQQLENGLTILAECNPRAHTAAFGVFVNAGSRDESEAIGGVSHFLEHMVFKGTPNRTAEQVNRQLDAMGSHSNARTGEDSTIYHATVLPDFQADITELLADLMRPSLRDEDFETEKQVIIEEIMMYDDQPPYGGHERLMRDYFGSHPLGNSVLGTVESVSGLTPEKMHEYFQKRYAPDNMAIAAAGDIDFDRLIEDANKFCGDWKAYDAPRKFDSVQPHAGFETMVKTTSTQQYIMQLSHGPATEDEDRYAAHVLSMILGDDSGSRMFWDLLDTGLAESAGVGVYEYQARSHVVATRTANAAAGSTTNKAGLCNVASNRCGRRNRCGRWHGSRSRPRVGQDRSLKTDPSSNLGISVHHATDYNGRSKYCCQECSSRGSGELMPDRPSQILEWGYALCSSHPIHRLAFIEVMISRSPASTNRRRYGM